MKARLSWWQRGIVKRQKQDFGDFHSDEFNDKLSELMNNPVVFVIRIEKKEVS